MNYSLKELLENHIKEMGYIINGEWEDSLKNGWRIAVKFHPVGKEDYHYSTIYAEDILCEMLHEELGKKGMEKIK